MNPFPEGGVSRSGPAFDPRVKLAWLLANVALAVWHQHIGLLVLQLILILGVNRWIGLSLGRLRPLFQVTAVLGLQLVLLQGFLQPEGSKLFVLAGLGFYAGGALLGLKGILLILVLSLLFFQFLSWTSPREITLLLIKMRLPYRYAFTAGMAVRFLPLLQMDLQSIYQSQLSRGLHQDGLFKKIKGLPPIILPLILMTLRRAEAVARSMELKGFGLQPRVTLLAELKLKKKDFGALAAIACYGILLAWW
ncbi:MAG: energy-coupling factor transporter transmembrane protein EcfT [Deltaproteobacteria bacterium]|nr:energy-coupling factor transporter transmembrane protein EcfT [Deltaproteobacteria bacterium]